MNPDVFFENFELLADAPNGVQKLRELILQLAVMGKLVPQDPNDEPASILIEKIKAEKRKLGQKGNNRRNSKTSTTISDEIFDIPSNWIWTKLGNLGITQTGTTPSKNEPKFFGNYISFIKPADMSESGVKYGNEMLSELGLSLGRFIPKNSVLMVCIGGSIGKTCLVDRNVSCNQQINAISPFPSVDCKFITLVFKSRYFQDKVMEKASIGTLPIINKSKWEQISVPLPPLAEQKRIVSKVDELMALCDKLEVRRQIKQEIQSKLNVATLDGMLSAENKEEFEQYWQHICENFDLLYDNPENVEKLRQAILQLAVQGKLVSQNPGDEPASVLIENIKAEKRRLIKERKIKSSKVSAQIDSEEIPYELPDKWEWIRIEDITDIGTGSTPLKSKNEYYEDGSIPWITSSLTSLNYIDKAETCITETAVNEYNLRIYPSGTLLVALYGQGKTRGQVSELRIGATINQACASIVFIENFENIKQYVKVFFEQKYEELRALAAGGAQPNLNVGKIKETLIPLPPLAEQKRIVEKVEQLMGLCDELKAKLRKERTGSEKLMEAVVKGLLEGEATEKPEFEEPIPLQVEAIQLK
jgi:type I restriction enzyme S subunit